MEHNPVPITFFGPFGVSCSQDCERWQYRVVTDWNSCTRVRHIERVEYCVEVSDARTGPVPDCRTYTVFVKFITGVNVVQNHGKAALAAGLAGLPDVFHSYLLLRTSGQNGLVQIFHQLLNGFVNG